MFLGKDVPRLPKRERRAAHHGMQVVFQDPCSSLYPRMTAHDLIAESLRPAKSMKGDELWARVVELLELVALTDRTSGGGRTSSAAASDSASP